MNLSEVLSPSAPARFHIDGKRVSRAHWEAVKERAYADGTLCCFSTRAKQMPGGTFKRWNYSYISAR